jgi:YHS domain-containing protein
MTKLQIFGLGMAVLVVAVTAVVRAKRISPLGWGWYGTVQTTDGAALRGYDPVAYQAGNAVLGNAAHAINWNGAEWRFASAENKAAFVDQPEHYAPQFGGFCAYASSKGFTATVDPTAFKVEGGKLYVFNDAGMREKWIAELPRVISQAEENWKRRPH